MKQEMKFQDNLISLEIGNGNGGIISVLWGLNWFYDTKA